MTSFKQSLKLRIERSTIRKENIIEISVTELPVAKEVVTVQPQVVQQMQEQKAAIQNLPESEDKINSLLKCRFKSRFWLLFQR